MSNEFYAVLIGALIGWLFTSWHRSIVELVRYRHIKKLKDAFHDSWAGWRMNPSSVVHINAFLVNSDAYLDAFRDESDTGSGTRLISSVAEIGKDWKVNYTRLANSSLSISISEHDAPTEESADD